MKKIKILVLSFVILPLLFLIGESSYNYANRVISNSCPNLTIKVDEPITDPDEITELIGRIEGIGQKYRVSAYIVETNYLSSVSESITIYCSISDEEKIKKIYGIKTDHIKSMLFGELNIGYKRLEDITEISGSLFVNLIGNKDNCGKAISFFAENFELKQVSTEVYPYKSMYDKPIYAAAAVLTIILSVFDVENKKKELIVKILFGESRTLLIAKNIIKDYITCLAIFILCILVCSSLNSVLQMKQQLFILLIIVLICSALPYMSVALCNYSSVLKNKTSKQVVLLIANVINCCVIVLVTLSLSFLYNRIDENAGYIKAQKLFSDNDYYFCDFNNSVEFEDNNDVDMLDQNERIYRDYYNDLKPIMLNGADISFGYGSNNTVYANSNAAAYICDWVGVDESVLDAGFNIIYHESTDPQMLDTALYYIGITEFPDKYLFGDFDRNAPAYDFKYKFICMDRHYKCVALNQDNNDFFEQLSDPIIIINTLHADNIQSKSANRGSAYAAFMYKIKGNTLEEIKDKFRFEQIITSNCMSLFQHFWQINRISIYFMALAAISMVLVEILLNVFILSNYFDINSIEICLKKVYGYSRAERCLSLINGRLIYILLGFVGNLILCLKLKIAPIYLVIIISVCLALIDISITVVFFNRIENKNIIRIFKGDDAI